MVWGFMPPHSSSSVSLVSGSPAASRRVTVFFACSITMPKFCRDTGQIDEANAEAMNSIPCSSVSFASGWLNRPGF